MFKFTILIPLCQRELSTFKDFTRDTTVLLIENATGADLGIFLREITTKGMRYYTLEIIRDQKE